MTSARYTAVRHTFAHRKTADKGGFERHNSAGTRENSTVHDTGEEKNLKKQSKFGEHR
jgi:hypothetical protein